MGLWDSGRERGGAKLRLLLGFGMFLEYDRGEIG